ncbi:hypothetical protein [Nostoc sp.]|uniref:hypothetical protein n=1 Tax=Nostoc sp. TaxID=1180 RepID=UPI00359390B9
MQKITLVDLTDKLAGNPKDCLELTDSILRRVCESDKIDAQANRHLQQNGNMAHAEAEEWQMPEF